MAAVTVESVTGNDHFQSPVRLLRYLLDSPEMLEQGLRILTVDSGNCLKTLFAFAYDRHDRPVVLCLVNGLAGNAHVGKALARASQVAHGSVANRRVLVVATGYADFVGLNTDLPTGVELRLWREDRATDDTATIEVRHPITNPEAANRPGPSNQEPAHDLTESFPAIPTLQESRLTPEEIASLLET